MFCCNVDARLQNHGKRLLYHSVAQRKSNAHKLHPHVAADAPSCTTFAQRETSFIAGRVAMLRY